jgi:hypothetical protein
MSQSNKNNKYIQSPKNDTHTFDPFRIKYTPNEINSIQHETQLVTTPFINETRTQTRKGTENKLLNNQILAPSNSSSNIVKTDNDAKLMIHTKKKIKDIPKDLELMTAMSTTRYGTTLSLQRNKISSEDKYKTRNKETPQIVENEKYYRMSRINIDSRYRNKSPQNSISYYVTSLSSLYFKENSPVLKIALPENHGFKVDTNITLSGLIPITITQRSFTLTFVKNDRYMYIHQENHGFVGDNNMISINDVVGTDSSGYFIGNIPLSRINTEHNVILIINSGVIDYNNYKVDIGIYSMSDVTYNKSYYNINILTYNGVHIKYINASYPITNNVQQGYQTVIESGTNYIKINMQVNASKSNDDSNIGIGNGNIEIGLITSEITGFPDPSSYTFELKKTYRNVKKIKLVSTEIPNTETLIKNAPTNLKNNILYWQIQDDGNHIYSVTIESGNYDASSLRAELITKISNVYRQFGQYLNADLYYDKCIPSIIINPDSNMFSIQIMSVITLANNIIVETTIYSDNHTRINITQPYHNLSDGDVIIISGAINVSNIPNDIINNKHIIESVEGINNYIIKLPIYNPVPYTYVNNITKDITNIDNHTVITVTQQSHNLTTGDTVIISNATDLYDHSTSDTYYYIPSSVINGEHIIDSVVDNDSYKIKLPYYNAIKGIKPNEDNHGGDAINITFPLTIRLMFNYSDTFGNILGYTNVGDSDSITIFDKIITNNTYYINNSIINSVGIVNTNIPILNFNTYPYIFITSPIFNSIINIRDGTGVFAKLFLSGSPGSIIYDQYIQINDTISTAISSLDDISFLFYTPDNNLYCFNNQDNSFTIEIYEELAENENIKD